MANEARIIQSDSRINYSYATVRLTKSRIDKGLIAVPTALADWFPDRNTDIQVYLNDSGTSQSKGYSYYTGSTKECRIGGLKQWFEENDLKSGDEVVVQLIDQGRSIYRLIPERDFLATTLRLQIKLDNATDEDDACEKLARISGWTNTQPTAVALNEYRRLADSVLSPQRSFGIRASTRARESVPASLRTLLGQLYHGHCQVCDFWFPKKNKQPYFEVHHLDPAKGHHPKNLVVVCGNCHNQFEHADVTMDFDDESWLIRVFFTGRGRSVHQIGMTPRLPNFSKELYL